MEYTAKSFETLLGLPGFSDVLLKNHLTLYQGYVANTNKVAGQLSQWLKAGATATPEYAELKRRFGWEFNGMRLHEYYFGNLTKAKTSLSSESALGNKITEEFGSITDWEKDFRATGALRGIGWVILSWDGVSRRLFNTWINEHDGGHLGGATPLLVMDVFEHAFMVDYGLKRADYIQSFFSALDWAEVQRRFDVAAK